MTLETTKLILGPRRHEEGQIVLSAQASDPAGGVHTLWFRVPETTEAWLTGQADPFLIGFLFPFMHWGRPVRVCGTVSPSLLANLELFTQVWHMWRPDLYQSLTFIADEEKEPEPASGEEAIACFSGGVDSCYTFWRHHQGQVGRRTRRLTAGVIVQGFADLPLAAAAMFETAQARCRRMLGSIGVETIPVATNAQSLPTPGRHSWTHGHETAIGAILSLFSRRFSHGLVANSVPYRSLGVDYGTNPITDPLLSASRFSILDDGGEVSRLQKLEAIVDWPEAMADLRVCNSRTGGDRNCCVCEKCIRTIISLRLFRKMLPACFDRDVTDQQIRRVDLRYAVMIMVMERIREEARARGLGDASWVRAMAWPIRRCRFRMFRKQLADKLRGLVPGS